MTHHVAPREALVRASWTPVVAVEHAGLLGTYTMCVWMILGVMGCTGGTGRGGGGQTRLSIIHILPIRSYALLRSKVWL